ncbi:MULTISPECIES: cisplatin damage response ATP-dependent DNA ligase [unclassified Sphingopyxis]|uniref:cisplatin damage response ATP-dependent DNA ligase n=1 Tax=unclassified Sphingopyxis TaxID=2614943 RepID=UPI00286389F2|nr:MULTISPECIES: cisplatin damage response ATP-dependent DNA ligase [unclassified Sphingopyxis]MDR6832657.1 DNA ligase-1 [Sphingopyxis sp. BE122]MDR7228400.1 DNA ligase-1 [Sphingopyxis sp. BE259]
MKAFAALIDRLIYTRSRNSKLALIADYLKHTPDPDRGWAIAALTESLDFPAVKSAMVRALLATRVDEELFRLSRHFVGDTAETAALLWPDPPSVRGEERLSPATARLEPPAAVLRDAPSTSSGAAQDERNSLTISEAVDALSAATRATAPAILADLLDRLDVDGRYALLKLALGGMRVGVSARLAKQAFAQAFDVPVDDVEELWHAIPPPYAPLLAWGEGRAERPDLADVAFFRPFMLAHPLEDGTVDLADYAAEWKWDGIRVQIVRGGSETRIYSRGGEEISAAFPELVAAFDQDAVIDGELLVRGDAQGGEAASFNALQQRLGRKTVSKKMLAESPAFVRVYDLLAVDGNDLRLLPWTERRRQLETFVPHLADSHFDLSQVIDAKDFDDLATRRAGARDAAIEGVMLKRRDAPYVAGRRAGLWYKWKRDPLTADCVMMYAQRGNGRRASFYSDYTFGCWSDDGELLPVGKAYSGFTDEELKWLDKFVRDNTLNRFGPVREVEKSLVLEVAFDSIHASKRHKSGLAMRFPRISRIRRDKPAEEADRIAALLAMVT